MNTKYFLNLVSGNVFQNKKTPAIPSAYYIGLSKSAPTLDGENVTEPSGGGYARVLLTNLSDPVDGVVTNTQLIDFAESTAGWGIVTHFVIFDALTAGNLLMYGPLTTNRTVESGTIMTIKQGALALSAVNPTV